MNHIHGHPHSKKAEFYKLLLDYDESIERDLADCRAIWYESGTHNLMVGDYGITDRIVTMIISKNFGFIQRLVENDKIDFSNIKNIILDYEVEDNEVLEYYNLDFADKEETLLMLLSIQDNPISFLTSVLK